MLVAFCQAEPCGRAFQRRALEREERDVVASGGVVASSALCAMRYALCLFRGLVFFLLSFATSPALRLWRFATGISLFARRDGRIFWGACAAFLASKVI